MKKLVPFFVIFCLLLSGCGFAGENYRNYVTAMLDCTYHDEKEEYQRLTNASHLNSEVFFTAEKNSLAQRLCDTYGIKSDKISEETKKGFSALAESILKKTKYTVRDVLHENDNYTVVLVISPVDFWNKAQDSVRKYYYSEFLHKYKTAPTREDADLLEEEYAFRVLEILMNEAEQIDYLEPVVYTCTIQNNTVSPDDWTAIDKLVLHLS